MKKAFLLLAFMLSAVPAMAAKYKGRLVPGVWDTPWTTTLHDDLMASPLMSHRETQIETLCPGYKTSEAKRKLFWQQLMVSLSWKESMHGPGNYVHFKGGTNDGLFQINPRLRSYYDCKDYDLFDPISNIRCAVKMAVKLVKRYGTFLNGKKSGMAAYWQPLRGTSRLNRKNRAAILAEVGKACSTGEIIYRCKSIMPTGHEGHGDGHGGDVMDEMDLSFNTIDDLGIPADQLDPEPDLSTYDAPTFEMDPAAMFRLGVDDP